MAKATELLLEHMAVKAAAAARDAKRKTVKFADVERAGAPSHASPCLTLYYPGMPGWLPCP